MLWRRNQFAVTAAAFVGFIGFTLVMPFLARYVQELGVTDTGEVAVWTGITLGVTPGVAALCSPFWGRIADRFGNKVLVQRSLISFVIVNSLMAYASAAWQLFALRALQGFVAGYGPLTISMVALSAPRDKMARAIGMVQTAQRIGPAVGPVIGALLASAVGLRNTFLVSAGVYAAALVVLTFFYTDPQKPPAPAGVSERASFTTVLGFENLLLLMLVIFGLQLVDRSFGPVMLLHINQLGFQSGQAAAIVGILFSLLAICGALGNQVAAMLLRRLTARAVIATAVLVAAAALTIFAIAEAPWLLMVAIAVVGATIGAALTTAFTAAGSVIPRHAHGAGFGFLTGASLIGSAVSPVLSGLVGAQSIRLVFVTGAIVLAILALVVRGVMVERTLEIERVPAVDES